MLSVALLEHVQSTLTASNCLLCMLGEMVETRKSPVYLPGVCSLPQCLWSVHAAVCSIISLFVCSVQIVRIAAAPVHQSLIVS